MISRLETERPKLTYEILIPNERILRSVLNQNQDRTARIEPIEVNPANLPTWPLDSFFLANIGDKRFPLQPELLELRFAEAHPDLWIALLMTNERTPHDLEIMAQRFIEEVGKRGVEFEAVIGVEASGSKLSQEIARLMGPKTLQTTFQKGKPKLENGQLVIGPPKNWVDRGTSEIVTSGTNIEALQAIFMDQEIAKAFGNKRVLIVDDARLTSGTADASIRLARKMGLNLACVATVLNEAEPAEQVMGVPYISLAKIPVFRKTPSGFQPIEGSFDEVQYFYQEM